MTSLPELRLLRAFVAVAEELSFTRAAESLGLAQQTVSKTIRELETDLGIELLERTTRAVRLTDAGTALLEPARETLRQLEAAIATARAVGTGEMGVVRIGMTPSIAAADTREVARAIHAQSAKMNITFCEVPARDVQRLLSNREIDLALSRSVGVGDPSLHHHELRPTPARIFLPVTHHLAGCATATLSDFDGERLLANSPSGTPFTDLLVSRFRDSGADVHVVESRVTGGAGTLLTELAGMNAIAVKPAGTEPPEGVTSVLIPGLTVPLRLLWPAGLPSRVALWLREMLGR